MHLRAEDSLGHLPRSPNTANHLQPWFEQNIGQFPATVQFIHRAIAVRAALGSTEISFIVGKPERQEPIKLRTPGSHKVATPPDVVTLEFVGADRMGIFRPVTPIPGVSNYYRSNKSKEWISGLHHFSELTLGALYKGIDLAVYTRDSNLEYDFVVSPHADPKQIKLRFRGAQTITIQPNGDLRIRTVHSELIQQKARAYQDIEGVRTAVSADYEINGDTAALKLGPYNPDYPLIIDPTVLYATYLGGDGFALPCRAAADNTGALAFVGVTAEKIPLQNAAQGAGGDNDGYVIRLSPTANALVFATFLGGSGADYAETLAFATDGTILVGGFATSPNFPILGARQSQASPNGSGFISRFSPSGQLLQSTYHGGTQGFTQVKDLAVGTSGKIYATGSTSNPSFEVLTSLHPYRGGNDAFISVFSADLTTLLASTLLGGSANDQPQSIRIDQSENIFISGMTTSPDLPTVNAAMLYAARPQGVGGTNSFDFVFKLAPDAKHIIYGTYWGSPYQIGIQDGSPPLAVDAAGNAYLVGNSHVGVIPQISGPLQPYAPGVPLIGAVSTCRPNTFTCAHIAKFSPTGAVVQSSYLGGEYQVQSIHVRPDGNLVFISPYVGYSSTLPAPNFGDLAFPCIGPTGPTSFTPNTIIEILKPDLSPIWYGCVQSDRESFNGPTPTAMDPAGNIYVVFQTLGASLIASTPGVWKSAYTAANGDHQIIKFGDASAQPPQTNGAPSVTATGPINTSGVNQTLTFKFTHPTDANNLTIVNALINNVLDGGGACYVAYSQQLKVLYLVNDQGPGSGLSPGLPLSSSGNVSNSQCTVFSSGSSATSAGMTLTLTMSIAFKSSFIGNKVIYLAAQDNAGRNTGWQTMGVSQIPEPTTAYPRTITSVPATGTTASQTIAFTYQDASNFANLQTAWALINTAIDGRAACYAAYYAPGNQLYLYPDNGDGTQAKSIVLTGSNVIENSQCTISATGSSAVRTGNQLTLNLNITFKPPFAGSKAIWTAVQTMGGAQTSPWRAIGAWQVPR